MPIHNARRLFSARAETSRKVLLPTIIFLLILACLPYSAKQVSAAESVNLVPNPSVESQSGTVPTSWSRGRWGANTAVFRYPVTGVDGARAVEVELTQRTSGDAKWYFSEVPITGGAIYRFTDRYKSTVGSHVTLQYRHASGAFSWVDIGAPASSAAWQTFDKTFTAPASATHLTVFHLIKAVGVLRTDAFTLRLQDASPSNAFSEGFVSIHFDDGWKTAYQNGLPILQAAGLKSSQYIITERFNFPAYVTESEVLDMYQKGHEIGGHTRTHRDLTTLSAAEKQSEIAGSRQDLLDLGITPSNTFAYPFGAYDQTTTPIVQQAGYIGARTSDGGFNLKTGNRYLLKRQPVGGGATVAQVKAWIEQALAQKTWLILVFHRIDASGTDTSITPQLFQQIVDEIKASGVPVRSTSQGIQLMSS